MIGSVSLAVGAFVSTNVDDLALLLGIVARGDRRPGAILAGHLIGMAALTATAAGISGLAIVIPATALRWLGLVPMLLGIRAVLLGPEHTSDVSPRRAGGVLADTMAVATLTVANGGDNVAATVPLLAAHGTANVVTVCLVYAGMTVAWYGLALNMVAHPRFGTPIRRWAGRLFPYGLVALGGFILLGR